jgi:hypothetical protein
MEPRMKDQLGALATLVMERIRAERQVLMMGPLVTLHNHAELSIHAKERDLD